VNECSKNVIVFLPTATGKKAPVLTNADPLILRQMPQPKSEVPHLWEPFESGPLRSEETQRCAIEYCSQVARLPRTI